MTAVWVGGRAKYFVAKAWTTGSISTIVVLMLWAMSAAGVVPMPRPLLPTYEYQHHRRYEDHVTRNRNRALT